MTKSSVVYQPNFAIPSGAPAPDAFPFARRIVPRPDFVVSRRRDGKTESQYGQRKWKLGAYEPRNRSANLDFFSWLRGAPTKRHTAIIEEMRLLMFIVMWIREGPTLAVGTVINFFKAVRALARFASELSLTIHEVLISAAALREFLNQHAGEIAKNLAVLLRLLLKLGESRTTFRILGGKPLNEILKHARAQKGNSKQHPPIPSRIYTQVLAKLDEELADFEAIAERFLDLVARCAKDPLYGKSYQSQYAIAKRLNLALSTPTRRPTFSEALALAGLTEYFQAKGLPHQVAGLAKGMTEIQLVSKFSIHAYSGARDEEAGDLPFYCLKEFKARLRQHHQILGAASKHNSGRRKRTCWVTSKEGARAIRVAQMVALAIYKFQGVLPHKGKRHNEFPLFVSPHYLPFAKSHHFPVGAPYRSGYLNLCNSPKLRKRLQFRIEEEALVELERIDTYRAWRSEPGFRVGAAWRLTTHQLRRSLVLYASSSGLVSLPSLRRQMQHVTKEMTEYYGLGSEFAKNIIGDDKDHVGAEFQEAQPDSQALAYMANILMSDEPLFGGHGAWVERSAARRRGVLTVDDRRKTMRQFRNGESAYCETIFGGCSTRTPCRKRALRSIVGCLDCEHSSIKVSRLDEVIRAEEVHIMHFHPKSVEWRTETADLAELKAFRVRCEAKLHRSVA